MEKNSSFYRYLIIIVIGCLFNVNAYAVSVNIEGLSSVGEVEGYPLYEVSASVITVSSSSGGYFYIYIDDNEVLSYSSKSYKLNISQYFDGKEHKMTLNYGETDRGTCYFKMSESSVNGIFYSVAGENASVTASINEIELANIPDKIEINGEEYLVTSINQYAFYNRTALKSVVIPESVTSIGDSAFEGCSSFTSLSFNAVNCTTSCTFPPSISNLTFGDNVTEIPCSFLSKGSQIASVTIPDSVTSIGSSAFRNNVNLKAIEIPESVTSIGSSTFQGCSALTSIIFNATNCTSFGSDVFPSSITTLTLGEGVMKIPSYFLSKECQIESLTIPESVTSIGSSAFRGCSSMTSLTFNAINCSNLWSDAFPTNISDITIGDRVTRIPANFLKGGSKIETVTLPHSLTSIGESAFSNSANLKSIEIPEAVTSIENNAFFGCSSLTSLTFNATNYTSYGSSAYPMFPSTISSLTIGDGVTKIPAYFISNGSQIDSLTIPESVTSIGNSAFSGCSSLTSLTFNATNCTSCGSSNYPAFPSSISSLSFGDDVIQIPDYLLYNGGQIVDVTIPEAITSIGNAAFNRCTSLTSLTFNATNCTICSSSAFPSSLTTLSVGNGVTQIPSDLLYNGSQIESIILPNSVTSVGSYAFLNSNNLKSLTIGSGLLSIGTRAFSYKNSYSSDYYKLTIPKVFWLGNTPPANVGEISASVNYVANDKYSFSNQVKYQFLSSKFLVNGTWYVPVSPSDRTCDVVDCEYSLSNCEVTIPEKVNNRGVELSVLNINNYSYYKNNTITSLSASNNGNLGDYSFYECKALTSVIANNAGSIGNDAFYNCGNLNNVELGNSLTTIGDYAFSKCTALPAITLPNNVTSIGERIFRDCSQLATVDIGTGIASIPGHSFAYCSSLNNLVIPKNVMNIGDYVFSGCRSLANFTMEDGDETLQIGSNGSSPLFYDCPLDVVYIGRKLSYKTASTSGYSPFYRNTSLRSVEVTDAETQIYDNEFYGCTNLKTLKIGNGVEAIGKWAFSGCSSLDYFSAGYHVETIGEEAFSDCTGLTSYYSFSILPPVCGNQALDDINKWDCTLFVPAESSDEYMAADQWKDFFFVNENDAVLIENICINVESLNGETGDTFQLTADIFPGNATRKRIDWSSSDPTIVKVDADGLATFVMEGYATITARATDGSGVEASIDVVVTVKEPELGDSNANGRINIADAVNTANYAIGNEVEHFNATAADVNKDGIITLADASATITLVLEQEVPDVAAGVRAIARAAEINSGRFYIDEAYIEPGESKTLAFNLDNEVQYYGFQADITLPKGVEVEDEDGSPAVELSSRTNSSYSVVTNPVSSSLIRVGAFSTSHMPIEGDSGALMYLNVVADDEFDGGVLSVTDIRFVNNADVDVPFPAFSVEMRNNAVNRCYLPDFSISAGQTKTVSLMLDNETPFTAFQADIYLPDGMNIVADSFKVGSRAANHSVSAKSFSDGRTRLICSSPDNSLFSGDEGAILEFEVNVNPEFDGTCVIELRNQVCSTANAKEYVLANSTTSVTVINDIVTGLDGYRLSDISVMVIGSRIIIKGLPDGVIANLYNLCGALVNSAIGNGAAVSMDVAPSGVYILRIGSDAMKIAVP